MVELEAEDGRVRERGGTDQPISIPGQVPVQDARGFSREDWLIIDEALHRVARSLRRIETEAKQQGLQEPADTSLVT